MLRQMPRNLPIEALVIETMASGELSLLLTERVTWEGFPAYAMRILDLVHGHVTSRADSAAERVWAVMIEGQSYWLSFDDFPLGVSLESRDAGASQRLPAIRELLLSRRDSPRHG